MNNLHWTIKRLRAMNLAEICWRLEQFVIQKREQTIFNKKERVIDRIFNNRHKTLTAKPERMHLNYSNTNYSIGKDIELIGGYSYKEYKYKWNAGFQSNNQWPLTPPYRTDYRNRDDIGDARTNWELNKHFQFVLLAKDYYVTGEKEYLEELKDLFYDWNDHNPFLWGLQWTSAIEIAERVINWCYMYSFLKGCHDVPLEFERHILNGIINMADYVRKHQSRFSSANNHRVIEISSVLHVGILFDYRPWILSSTRVLTYELKRQNYPDGVNKEQSLYYQGFFMEAIGLDYRLLEKNDFEEVATWVNLLKKMSRYIKTCIGSNGEIIEFGDNDNGKIIDFNGFTDHYSYVLEMYTLLLDEDYRYNVNEYGENVSWLFTNDELKKLKQRYVVNESKDYILGGNAYLRSKDGNIFIGIDHAPLGFDKLAAHAHADALSFQLFVGGECIFADPGTYIYHCEPGKRDYFRSTENHNTLTLNGSDQSEMLGAFLWGKKANCKLIRSELTDDADIIVAEHDGYKPVIHKREFLFDKEKELVITDYLSEKCSAVFNILLGLDVVVEEDYDNHVILTIGHKIESDKQPIVVLECISGYGDISIVERNISPQYGIMKTTKGLRIPVEDSTCKMRIKIGY